MYKDTCGKCGASRIDAQLGLEPTPEQYIENMVAVFREVWRVLKTDGTLWLNLGDSYNAGRDGGHAGGAKQNHPKYQQRSGANVHNLKPKDLCGIPWRVALALQADGWWLRSDIIWHKPNPMPESVTDRPTKSHEYMFLLTKAARYYYDADAIKEKATSPPSSFRNSDRYTNQGKAPDNTSHKGTVVSGEFDATKRNKRSVWTVTTKPYKGAHFATFPPKLIEPCILAGSAEGDTVLDPFSGSGTTGQVSIQHKRKYVGLELNMEYIDLAKKRTNGVQVQMI